MIKTLFMLLSLDGKISTGSSDERDFDKDLPNIPGVKEGVGQYDELEQQTDLYSFNTGKVMAKVGWNEPKKTINKIPVTFVLVDSKPHLTKLGIENLLKRCEALVIATTNNEHPSLSIENDKLTTLTYEGSIDLQDMFNKVEEMGADRITLQSGGEMNAVLLRNGLIDELSVVVAPMLVGGRRTPTLIDGESLLTQEDLTQVKALELIEAKTLDNNFLHLRYVVKN
jgi:2,5-diamino-6-(ribosylamino)-4(3H)-pyrimidinone 5'-phosphate reductase